MTTTGRGRTADAASAGRSHALQSFQIGVIGGDGIGPVVTAEACKVLRAAAEASGLAISMEEFDVGADRYLATGETLPASVLADLSGVDAVLLGAIGSPQVQTGILERGIILKLRRVFDLYANIRPSVLMPGVHSPLTKLSSSDWDVLVVRENVEGLYVNAGSYKESRTGQGVATQHSINTSAGVSRIIEESFRRSRIRKKRVTLVHKTNVLEYAGGIWRRVFADVARRYPDVLTDYLHVDAACLHVINSSRDFDVIVTDSMFGDILSDLTSAVAGGIGYSPSANLNPQAEVPGIFEPIHGSAPDLTEPRKANPIGAVLAGALCLEELGARTGSDAIRSAVEEFLAAQPEAERESMWTADIGDKIAELI